VIANGRMDDVLLSISDGKPEGTLLAAASDRLESRKRWILGNVARGGFIVVDAGAAAALRAHGRSLLPAGIARVEGTFERGDAVDIRDAEGHRVAAGTANYSSDELVRIGGLHSDRIAETLGYAYGDEAVHRDNMILL
ncbi:MAG TPA: PUA domain-containing protein, partial [Tepidiformaceae bacterium]|nr:PUA domain-containing protein [Tepidiformaceae bacterium]